jgi:MFS family permease
MKGILFKKSRDFYIRLPFGLIIIVLFGFSPIIIAMIGGWASELISGIPCHEGNCAWAAFGWLFFLTIPISIVLLVIFIIILIIDIIRFSLND